MSKTIYLTVPDASAWQTLSITAWPDGIPKAVSVDGPFRLIDQEAALDGDGNVVTPASYKDVLGVNLAAQDSHSWPDEIVAASVVVNTPVREFAE